MAEQASQEQIRQAFDAARAQADSRSITEEGIERAKAPIGVEVSRFRVKQALRQVYLGITKEVTS